jgi:dynein heavy chain
MKECTNEIEEDTIFADFMEESGGKYVEVPYKERENLKRYVEDKLKEYNEKTKASAMNIVLFQEAIQYVCKINRIIKLGKGHGMLVGEGGAGRHSLTKLSAFIADYRVW